jgi:PAS domain S-box-containing protein
MIFINDFDGNFIFSNRLRLVGYEENELKNMDVFSLIHPDDLKIVKNMLSRIVIEENINNIEYRIIRKNGIIANLSSNATLIRSHDGDPIGILTTTHDLTEAKRAQEDLIKSQRYYKKLFENMIDGFAYHKIILENGIPVNYEFVDINDSFSKIIGISREKVIGKKVTEALPGIENDPADWIGRYGKIALNQTSTYFESRSDLLNKTFLVHVYSPEKYYFVTIFTDITDRKKTEEDRFKLLKLESLSLLAGGIAHDYNNLLASILGYVNLIQLEENVNGDIYNSLKAIENATYRARDLTNQLLTFSKGGAPITKAESIKKIIDESISFCLMGSKSKAEVIYKGKLPIVEADAGQISQVLNNIIINADQSMPKGGKILISVSSEKIPYPSTLPLKEGEYVKISVKDEGIGIKQENMPHIFDPYFTTKKNGTGLGLATSFSIINRHNGYIKVMSKEGEGSTFFIYLPVVKDIENTFSQNDKISDKFEGKGKVLLMDDNSEILFIVKKMLIKIGLQTDVAENGLKAIDLYKKSIEQNDPYLMVILDLTVPGELGGKETIDQLKRIDPKVKAIVSSGYSNDPVLSEYTKFGFEGRILKPFTFEQLKEVIISVLQLNT